MIQCGRNRAVKDLFDRYVWIARILPGVFVMAPPVIALLFAAPSFEAVFSKMQQWVPVTSAWLLAVGLIARFGGRRIEPSLWRSWGGPPTTRMLRWSDSVHTDQWKQRMHCQIQRLTGMRLLGPEEEKDHPEEADRLINDVCGLLRTQTRDLPSSSLLKKANIEYGLTRNLLGNRWIFMVTSVVAVIISVIDWYSRRSGTALSGLLISIGFLLAAQILGFQVLPQLVRQIADRYAEELWSVVDTVDATDRKEQSNG